MPRERRTIEVVGRATLRVMPNVATVQLSVIARHPKSAAKAQAQTATTMDELINALNAETPITVMRTEPSLQAKYAYRDGESVFEAYEATNTLNFEVKLIDNIGVLLDVAARIAANTLRIDRVSFGIDEETRAQKALEVLLLATEDAKDKARSVAQRLNATVIGVRHAVESPQTPHHDYDGAVYARARAVAESAPAGANSVVPGIIEMEAVLSLSAEVAHPDARDVATPELMSPKGLADSGSREK